MMNTKKSIKEIIYEVLQDGQLHSISEIKDTIKALVPESDFKNNSINTMLYRLKKEDPNFRNPQKNMYINLANHVEEANIIMLETNIIDELKNEWITLIEKTQEQLESINYLECSDATYNQAKTLNKFCKSAKASFNNIYQERTNSYNSIGMC